MKGWQAFTGFPASQTSYVAAQLRIDPVFARGRPFGQYGRCLRKVHDLLVGSIGGFVTLLPLKKPGVHILCQFHGY
jgi:hypothetical protein